MSDTSRTPPKSRDHEDDTVPAREHGEYAKGDRPTKVRPHEKGDYDDPVKEQTGRGNASKGPWADQGGSGEGSNYGAREKRPKDSR
jgi:hypothetical protein